MGIPIGPLGVPSDTLPIKYFTVDIPALGYSAPAPIQQGEAPTISPAAVMLGEGYRATYGIAAPVQSYTPNFTAVDPSTGTVTAALWQQVVTTAINSSHFDAHRDVQTGSTSYGISMTDPHAGLIPYWSAPYGVWITAPELPTNRLYPGAPIINPATLNLLDVVSPSGTSGSPIAAPSSQAWIAGQFWYIFGKYGVIRSANRGVTWTTAWQDSSLYAGDYIQEGFFFGPSLAVIVMASGIVYVTYDGFSTYQKLITPNLNLYVTTSGYELTGVTVYPWGNAVGFYVLYAFTNPVVAAQTGTNGDGWLLASYRIQDGVPKLTGYTTWGGANPAPFASATLPSGFLGYAGADAIYETGDALDANGGDTNFNPTASTPSYNLEQAAWVFPNTVAGVNTPYVLNSAAQAPYCQLWENYNKGAG